MLLRRNRNLKSYIWQPIALKYCLDALQRNFPLVLGYSFYIIRPYKNGSIRRFENITVPNILYLYRLILFEQCDCTKISKVVKRYLGQMGCVSYFKFRYDESLRERNVFYFKEKFYKSRSL